MNSNHHEQLPTLLTHVQRTWGYVKTAFVVVSVFFASMFVLELWHLYRLAGSTSVALGWLVLIVYGIGVGLLAIPVMQYLRVPKALQPPKMPPDNDMERQDLLTQTKFFQRYLDNLERNPHVGKDPKSIQLCRDYLKGYERTVLTLPPGKLMNSPQGKQALNDLVQFRQRELSAALKELDERADRLIYQEALTVGLATAASPNGTLDAFVMLWRSIRLISQIASLYYGRPGLFGTLAVTRDVFLATAFAGFMQNISESLGGLVARLVGGVAGVVAGPAVDGLTNSLVLIRIGYLAQERCRSSENWDNDNRRSAILSALHKTQKVAVGLTTELFRQLGYGIGTVASTVAGTAYRAAGSAASGLSHVAGGLAENIYDVAGNAANKVGDVAHSAIGHVSTAAESAIEHVTDAAGATVSQVGNVAGHFFTNVKQRVAKFVHKDVETNDSKKPAGRV